MSVGITRPDFMDSSVGNTNRSYFNCCLRNIHDTAWLGLGRLRLGICIGLVSYKRSHQTTCLQDFRSDKKTQGNLKQNIADRD